jgi:hypothetical protein
MNEKISFSAVLGIALLSPCASIEAKPPTCTQPVGKWQDPLQSVLEIKSYDGCGSQRRERGPTADEPQ